MDVRTPQTEELANPLGPSEVRAPVKFLYPTGSQPLEGYTIKRGIGRGGFGEVYFATSDAGKEVALKLIRRNLDVELRGVRQCLNLKHPNLIAVYDIRTDSVGDQWVVMEYVSGESLEDAIERIPGRHAGRPGCPLDARYRGRRRLSARPWHRASRLEAGQRFLDLDSTPGGTVKIGDYGLSKFISCSRRSGQTESVGTVHYMAPEIANGRYGREIDTYALGIMLYEMLTGHVPFEGESVGEVLMKHLTAEPDVSMLEPPFRDIVERTLAKDPEVRIGSVGEMLALLPGGQQAGAVPLARLDGWSSEHAAADGIGAAHLFSDTTVRGSLAPSRPAPPEYHDREPLYDWFSSTWSNLVEGWHDWPAHRVFKAFLLLVMVGSAVATIGAWGRVAMVAGVVYLCYYLFWSVFVRPVERRRRARLQGDSPLVSLVCHGRSGRPTSGGERLGKSALVACRTSAGGGPPGALPPHQLERSGLQANRREIDPAAGHGTAVVHGGVRHPLPVPVAAGGAAGRRRLVDRADAPAFMAVGGKHRWVLGSARNGQIHRGPLRRPDPDENVATGRRRGDGPGGVGTGGRAADRFAGHSRF